MPPKAKYSKQEILEKAVEIIREQGIEKLTARELAAVLGTSARPIFTAFENMEDVKQECFNFAYDLYHSYFAEGLGSEPFKHIGKIYIRFAKDEPELFQLVFLQSQNRTTSFPEYMKTLDDNYEDTVNMICQLANTEHSKAEQIYEHMWIYSTGIAVLVATKQCSFTDQEIDDLLEVSCTGIVNRVLAE